MAENQKKTVRVEDLELSNSVTLAALVEVLKERGIVRREEILQKVREIRDRGNSMPHTYLQDIKEIISALTRDEELNLEGKLILLGMVTDHVAAVTEQLEDELATCKDGLTQ